MGHYITELLADELLDVPLPQNPISNRLISILLLKSMRRRGESSLLLKLIGRWSKIS